MSERKRTLTQIVNAIDLTANSLRDSATPFGRMKPEQMQRRLEQAVNEAIRTLQIVHKDLKYPMLIVETHVCDDCQVILNNLDPDEHCHGCGNEAQLQSYVPKDLRYTYMDPTEASAEEDRDGEKEE